ncbi:efflux transporter outer membrane subunit [Paenalcaligenes sp. Me131]|uniref:efflux transporter outer membrane subunit n=1 Tax=Paenalcaligenes sp. Me131 TaxID=3392636 RepID=UPI003D2D17A5
MRKYLGGQSVAVRRTAIMVACLVALSGCSTVGPDYRAPEIQLPEKWMEARSELVLQADQDRLRAWWQSFNDATLNQLVDQAISHNQDVEIALARLQQARAERMQIAAGLLPTISVGGIGEAKFGSRSVNMQSGGGARSWHAGFDASWELDIFGGKKRAVESADAEVEALTNDLYALQVSLIAELVSSYAELRTTQARLGIAHDNIRTLQESEKLALQSLNSGLGSSAEWRQAKAERELAQAQPPALEATIAKLSHTIGVLAGGFPSDWQTVLVEPAPTLLVAPRLPMSLPSEVLINRPDLRAGERRLAAATAQIGVAQAVGLPHFTIPLGIGSTASVIHNLFSGESLAWLARMQADQVLFDGGSAAAGVTAAQANAEAAKLNYERDIRWALRDVEDALTTLYSERQRQQSLSAAVEDSHLSLEHVTQLYRAGITGYVPVLLAQRSSNQAKDALALSKLAEVQGAIALYKAMGAGWQSLPAPV